MVATAAVPASILFMTKNVLGLTEKDLALRFGLPATLATILFVPVWFRITERIGRVRAWIVATIMVTLMLLSFLLARRGEPAAIFMARAFVFGIGTSGILLAVQALLTDTMQYDREHSGERREGILSGVYSSVEKFAFAFGPLLVGMLLDAGGYSKSAAVQTPAAERMIYFCVAVLPSICYLLSLPVLRAFRFDPANRGNHGG
jgi:GPH family glycoside/pentoside/hexuronide:cation symporter